MRTPPLLIALPLWLAIASAGRTEAAEARTSEQLVTRLVAPANGFADDAAAVQEVVEKLVEAQASAPILGAFRRGDVPRVVAGELIWGIGRMDSPHAADVLRHLSWCSRVVAWDIPDWAELARVLSVAARQPHAPAAFVAARLPEQLRRSIVTRGAAELTPTERERVLETLNSLVAVADLHTRIDTNALSLAAEPAELLERARKAAPAAGTRTLTEIESQRLNRGLIEAALGEALRPLAGLPVARFDPEILRWAICALAEMTVPEAAEVMLALRPESVELKTRQMELASRTPGIRSLSLMVDNLVTNEVSISAHAKRTLAPRLTADAEDVRFLLTQAVRELKFREEKDLLARVSKNVVDVMAALPGDEGQQPLVLAALDSSRRSLVIAVLESMLGRRAGLESNDVFLALRDLATTTDAGVARALLKVLFVCPHEEVPRVAETYLEHPDLEVRTLAVMIMKKHTRGFTALNPAAWVTRANEQAAAAAADGATPPAPPAAAAADARTGTSSLVIATSALVLAMLGVILMLARRSSQTGAKARPQGEARQSLRQQISLTLRYRFLSHDKAYAATGKEIAQTADVSATGARVRIRLPDTSWVAGLKERKVIVGIEIDLPADKQPVLAHATAAWLKPAGGLEFDVGLQFSEMTRADRERLQAMLLAKSMA
jgi:hypothetical protein